MQLDCQSLVCSFAFLLTACLMGRLCAHFLFAGLHDWLVLGRWIGSFGVANWMEGYLDVIAEFTSL